MEKRWQISDAIDQVHEQIRELMPSFYADVRMPQPSVSPNEKSLEESYREDKKS